MRSPSSTSSSAPSPRSGALTATAWPNCLSTTPPPAPEPEYVDDGNPDAPRTRPSDIAPRHLRRARAATTRLRPRYDQHAPLRRLLCDVSSAAHSFFAHAAHTTGGATSRTLARSWSRFFSTTVRPCATMSILPLTMSSVIAFSSARATACSVSGPTSSCATCRRRWAGADSH